jgi:hypothetical protein
MMPSVVIFEMNIRDDNAVVVFFFHYVYIKYILLNLHHYLLMVSNARI